MELVARAKAQEESVDVHALAAQVLAVDTASTAQDLDGVPDLSERRKVPRKQQKKKKKIRVELRREGTARSVFRAPPDGMR